MKGGIAHRREQTCAACERRYFWSPGLDLRPTAAYARVDAMVACRTG